ncbi:MAG: DUF1015 domain-containing protein [Oscillospiraceae bacterium]
MNNNIMKQANILLPQNADLNAFSVVACDQYTSEPDYWNSVKEIACDKPSALNMVFPEIYLKTADFDKTVNNINDTMKKYLSDTLFKEYQNAFIYVERTLKNGNVRKGIIGMIDLEAYDYTVGSGSAIRATEGTVLDRIPPRVKIRENAPIELPHVMLLIDDEDNSVIKPLSNKKSSLELIYSFTMMKDSGSIKGYLLDETCCNNLLAGIAKLADKEHFNARYSVTDKDLLLFAVGDGNHSLATARKCYMNLKEKLGEENAKNHPARYALVELVNLHDESLEFEAIHRVLFDVSSADVIKALGEKYILSDTYVEGAQRIDVVISAETHPLYITNPSLNLPVGSLQVFIDEYLTTHSGEVDYIHGDNVVKTLCKDTNTIGFILPSMDKNDLFKTVILDGALPRKTFSMGEACDKRFYLEARKISQD